MEIDPVSDNKFTAKCRLLQTTYRRDILKEPCGNGPSENSDSKHGNMLINGKVTGSNFISESAFEFAKQKSLDKQIIKDLTIEEYRLFNNMLSSMPMCFNLFSDLRKMLLTNESEVSNIIKLMFKEIDWIDKVTYIDIEFIPTPIKDYTNDKSAFDALIIVKDKKGKKGVISIETKYTDLLGSNTSKNSDTKNKIVQEGNFFDEQLMDKLRLKGYKQIHRNFILTYAYAKKNNFSNWANVIISPEEDYLSIKEIAELKQHMTKYDNCIFKISLEDIVQRAIGIDNKEISDLMTNFHNRYINFN
ncbi:MAG: hypothetical protein Q8S41_03130 [Lutibacter sp.]|nr:hypothetical protein [Lutibacter sp.]